MKILVVEDEKVLSDSICAYLDDKNYVCEKAYDYCGALEKINLYEYACIILDINLPNGNGLDLLRSLKKAGKEEGVLIISARNAVDDRVHGLQQGADDYLSKPFHLSELSARVSAIIRRKSFNGNVSVIFDELTLNIEAKTLDIAGEPITLTRKEYELLLYFISNKNRVVTKEAIVEHLWGDDFDMADHFDFLYSHIKNLRKKITQAGAPDYIKAIYGMGYKFTLKS
jgi:DNA-binding response OmpR family regulator